MRSTGRRAQPRLDLRPCRAQTPAGYRPFVIFRTPDHETARASMVAHDLAGRGITDERVLDAIDIEIDLGTRRLACRGISPTVRVASLKVI